jgi:hypothetical protein
MDEGTDVGIGVGLRTSTPFNVRVMKVMNTTSKNAAMDPIPFPCFWKKVIGSASATSYDK